MGIGTHDFGKGFTERNLWFMRDFFITFPKVNALRTELSWTHYRLLLGVERPEVRKFYMLKVAEKPMLSARRSYSRLEI